MTQTERPERRTPEQWSALVKEYEASGQSQRGFCSERGIGQSSLRYWRRRLQGDTPSGGRVCGARLLPVSVYEDRLSHAGSGLTLVVGSSLRIEIALRSTRPSRRKGGSRGGDFLVHGGYPGRGATLEVRKLET